MENLVDEKQFHGYDNNSYAGVGDQVAKVVKNEDIL